MQMIPESTNSPLEKHQQSSQWNEQKWREKEMAHKQGERGAELNARSSEINVVWRAAATQFQWLETWAAHEFTGTNTRLLQKLTH